MSVQAGIWVLDGPTSDVGVIDRIDEYTAKQGPDGSSRLRDGPILMLYRSCHTTRESQGERQPYRSALGQMITWEGRLDNRDELIALVSLKSAKHSDVEIVAHAFDQFGVNCFQQLKGDWACAIWNPQKRELLLAKDYIGLRHLYFVRMKGYVLWCNELGALITQSGCLTCPPSLVH